jgi:uncharacterized protein (DUF924 family)
MDPERILQFWFGESLDDPDLVEERCRLWFGRNPAFDEEIRQWFGQLPTLAAEGRLSSWMAAPRSSLALALVVDQFSRNLYRGSFRSFALDHLAVQVAETAIGYRFDHRVAPLQAAFFSLPLEHAESLVLQQRSVERFRNLRDRAPRPLHQVFDGFLDYAVRHLAVIRRFGRFPHRNQVLGRTSTTEELAYLAGGGETFGGGN